MLALVGRVEIRDWVDAFTYHQKVAPVGLLAWAACGKAEGWNPALILEEAHRNSRTSAEEWRQIQWEGSAPDQFELSRAWRAALNEADGFLNVLPLRELGKAVVDQRGEIYRGDIPQLEIALKNNELRFHEGHIGGVWPRLVPES